VAPTTHTCVLGEYFVDASSHTYLTLKLLEDEPSAVQHGKPTGVEHKRVTCGEKVLLRKRIDISSTEERLGKLDKPVLREHGQHQQRRRKGPSCSRSALDIARLE
jgi:hypothetical protein